MELTVTIADRQIPLEQCVYVLWNSCGCLIGVSDCRQGPGDQLVTEQDAWLDYYPSKRDRDRAQQRGCTMELMSRQRYVDEVCPKWHEPCDHGRRPRSRGTTDATTTVRTVHHAR